MGKYYAVKVGLVPGIYNTWEECKVNVHQCPNAKYKSFKTLKETKAYMDGEPIKRTPVEHRETQIISSKNKPLDDTEIVAYVDGSYNPKTNQYAYAAIIILEDGKLIKLADIGKDKDAVSMRNVAGEILASEQAMLFALNNGYKNIKIYHDYTGIAAWCDGSWQASKSYTQGYRDRYREISKKVNITFQKVKGHSGDVYNDMADELAKSMIFES